MFFLFFFFELGVCKELGDGRTRTEGRSGCVMRRVGHLHNEFNIGLI